LPAFSAALVLVPGAGSPAASETSAAWEALRPGAIVLFRHAIAPGTGDPSGMRLGDCSSQRNLDEAGRAQARRIGEAVRAQGVAVGAVLASRWCRAAETADLAFPGRARPEPAFDSFFAERGEGPARTAEARRILLGWSGPGALVVVTHQVNIAALTGVVPSSGEGVVLRRGGGDLVVVGRVKP
jgi:phosphohistidine phosphatase SixA